MAAVAVVVKPMAGQIERKVLQGWSGAGGPWAIAIRFPTPLKLAGAELPALPGSNVVPGENRRVQPNVSPTELFAVCPQVPELALHHRLGHGGSRFCLPLGLLFGPEPPCSSEPQLRANLPICL